MTRPGDREDGTAAGGGGSPARRAGASSGARLTGIEWAEAIYLAAWCAQRSGRRGAESGRPRAAPGAPTEPEGHQEHQSVPDPYDASPIDSGSSDENEDRSSDSPPSPAAPVSVEPPPPDPPHRSSTTASWIPEPLLEPEIPALRERQRLTAALRPFHLRLPNPRSSELDHETTAREYARALLEAAKAPYAQGHTRPRAILRPIEASRHERACRLTVLADQGPSMLLQRQMVTEFVALLRESVAFRAVRLVPFNSDIADTSGARLPDLGTGPAAKPDPSDDPHVVMVLSDGLGAGWHTEVVQEWLCRLARRFPVGIVHLLESRQWDRTGIRPRLVELAVSSGRATANRHYVARTPDPPVPGIAGGDTGEQGSGLLIPVMELRATPLRDWAGLVMGQLPGRRLRTGALRVVPGRAPVARPPGTTRALAGDDPAAAVRHFHQSSSPAAFRLAVALATVPLAPAMIGMVCDRTVGRASPPELTEILFSGLIQVIEDAPEGITEDRAAWNYRAGLREALLALGGRRTQISDLLTELSERFADRDPWFELLGRILRRENISELSLAGTSPQLAMDTLPALESISITDQYSDLFRAVRNSADVPEPIGTLALEEGPNSVRGRFRDGAGISGNSVNNLTVYRNSEGRDFAGQEDMTTDAPISPATGPRASGRSDASSTTVWGPVPRQNPAFTGRVDLLARLREQLTAGSGRLALTALHGMSGIGKTELAKQYLYLHRNDYDLIWWVQANRDNAIHASFASLAERLHLAQAGTTTSNLVQGVLEALRRGEPYRNWLIVFDSAEEPETLERYIPVDGPGHVIVTSRDSRWTLRGRDDFLVVDVFPREESIELLRKRGPEDLDDTDANRLAEALGDLPLALDQAAAWLYESATPVGEYLAQFEEKRADVLTALGPTHHDYRVPALAAWNLSLDKLTTINPAALQLLQICSFLASAPIPRYLFTFARDVPAPPQLSEALGDSTRLGRAIRDLGRFGLVQIDNRRHTLQLHRLVQEAVKLPLPETEQEEYRHCAHLLLARSDPQNTSVESRARYAQLLPHVWASRAWECTDSWVRDLVIQQVYVAEMRGEYTEGKRLGEIAHRVWREELGETAPQTLLLALRMVRTLRSLGRLRDAYELCRATRDTLAGIHGPDAEETLEASKVFIRDLRFAGEFEACRELAEQTLEKYHRLLGPDDPATLSAAHEYAFALLLTGAYSQAVELYEDVYRRREVILGPDAPETLGSADGYSDALMESGDYFAAIRLQEENVDRARALFGDDHLGTLGNQLTLTIMQRRTGQLEESVRLSGQVWRQIRDRFGPHSDDALYAALAHSTALRTVDRLGEALQLAEDAVAHYTALLSAEHPHVAAAEVNRAVTLRQMGRITEARGLDERALEVFLAKLGTDHPCTLSCAINLASDLFQSGDVSGAHELDQKNLEQCHRLLPERHPISLLARRNLAVSRAALGEEVSGELDEVERLYQEVLGPDHPATLSVRREVRGSADIYLGQP